MTEHANRALESKSLWHQVHLQSLPLSAAEPLPVLVIQYLLLPTMGVDWVAPDKLDDGVIERHQPFGLSVLRPRFF